MVIATKAGISVDFECKGRFLAAHERANNEAEVKFGRRIAQNVKAT